jgi:FtsX-like permease family
MLFVGAWLRVGPRRRLGSLAVLGLLVAVTGATVMTALAGARRETSAIERLAAPTLPATAAVLPNQPGFDWSRIRALPEVAAVSTFVVDYTMSVSGIDSASLAVFPPADDDDMRTIERPVVLAGRLADPTRSDEAVVTAGFHSSYHKGVGDTVVLNLPTPAELAEGEGTGIGGAYTGPQVRIRIVGLVRSLWYSDAPGSTGLLLPSPGLAARYPSNIIGDQSAHANVDFVNGLVRLRDGAGQLSRLRADIARVTGRSDIEITDLPAQYADVQREIRFEARSLVAFAAAAFVAALFLVGQALARYTFDSMAELDTLRPAGLARWQATAAAVTPPAIMATFGAGLAVVGAFAASAWFPIGTAAAFEPAPGLSADWLVFGPGAVAVIAFVTGGALLAARIAVSAAHRGATGRRSVVTRLAGRAGLGTTVVVGTRFALETGRGRAAVPVRPALLGAVTGVLGVVAAFTFSHGVADATGHVSRFGQTFQLISKVGRNSEDYGPVARLISALNADPAVIGVDDARIAVATDAGGTGSVTLYTYSAGTKPLPVVVLDGQMPTGADEVLLAPRTLAALRAHVGGRVRLRGGRGTATMTVAGSGLVPEGSHNVYADGGWLTPAGYSTLFTGFKYHGVLVRTAEGSRTSPNLLAARIRNAAPGLQGVEFEIPPTPAELYMLNKVKILPVALGGFLGLLAVGAVGHALAAAAHRRRHDLAVLRALGMTNQQCRGVIAVQASTLAAVGLLVGLPLGFGLGRVVWRLVADFTPVQYVPPVSVGAMLIIVPATLMIANLLGHRPARRAARLPVAEILRAD